jgi:predicted secreted protein
MTKIFTLILACAITLTVKAQTIPTTQAFGKIDKADLELKLCDFEKDANAMVLFDQADVYFSRSLITTRHKRIKIFNANAKNEGNIRIEYISAGHLENITNLQAQTINLNNGNIEITKVDKKQIFTEVVDDDRMAVVFSFPNVQAGSVLEYKYDLSASSVGDFPDWYFQGRLPTRYSELRANIPESLTYKNLESRFQPYAVDKRTGDGTQIKAIANIPSVPDEPYMTSLEDNCERLLSQLLSFDAPGYYSSSYMATWNKVGEYVFETAGLGVQLNKKLTGEEAIIAKANTLKTDDEKISYIFNEVKNTVKWDKSYNRYVYIDGVGKAWDKKAGNSTEMNIMVYHLLKKAGIKALPMLVSTRGHGKVNPAYPNLYKFNSIVVYIPVDSIKTYVLDAANRYNVYNQIPANMLNGFGLALDKDNKTYDMIFLQNESACRQVVLVNAEIKATNKLTGVANISNYSYNRTAALEKYNTDGEKKYIEYLTDHDNNFKVSGIKFENMEVDTLPLNQEVNFSLDLTGSDDNYIYFNPNMFGGGKTSPFLSINRFTDIDFGFRSNYALVGSYKLPAGYKVESIPKSASMVMSDASMTFRRIVAEQDGMVTVRYAVDHKKTIFFKEDYPEIHEFFKKMYEMLNEPIVLKKS